MLAIFMQQGQKREAHLKQVLKGFAWEVLADRYAEYPDFDARYHMYILKKEADRK